MGLCVRSRFCTRGRSSASPRSTRRWASRSSSACPAPTARPGLGMRRGDAELAVVTEESPRALAGVEPGARPAARALRLRRRRRRGGRRGPRRRRHGPQAAGGHAVGGAGRLRDRPRGQRRVARDGGAHGVASGASGASAAPCSAAPGTRRPKTGSPGGSHHSRCHRRGGADGGSRSSARLKRASSARREVAGDEPAGRLEREAHRLRAHHLRRPQGAERLDDERPTGSAHRFGRLALLLVLLAGPDPGEVPEALRPERGRRRRG